MLGMLAACSDDDKPADERRTYELQLSMGATSFNEAGQTRALPVGFEPYNQTLQPINQIQAYFGYVCKDENNNNVITYEPAVFTHTTSSEGTATTHAWKSRLALKTPSSDPKTYYLYGYMPREDVASATFSTLGSDKTYADGAILTLKGLTTVTSGDVCIIVGVKGYDASIPDMSYRLRAFDYYPDTDGKNLFLLVDHIYAALQVRMRLDESYAQLRQIKLKSITLTPGEAIPSTINATVTLTKDAEPEVSFSTPEEVNAVPQPASLHGVSGTRLLSEWNIFQACLYPTTESAPTYTMTTIYDVYDRKNNLIREDQTAQNTITLPNALGAGQRHTVNITVKPTYLYSLSDDDLDDPTFSITP